MDLQFGLCMCCGVGFTPDVDNFVQDPHDTCMMIGKIQWETKRDTALLELIKKEKKPSIGFCNIKHAAHLIHRTHHLPCVKYAIEHLCHNKDVKKYPLIINGRGHAERSFEAEWKNPEKRVDLGSLIHLITDLGLPNFPNINWEFNMTVDTCKDCNMVMTMEYWYRYHLYTSDTEHSEKLVPNEVIKISTVNQEHAAPRGGAVRIPGINNREQAKVGNYPKKEYKNTEDFFPVFVGYYLQMVLPKDMKKITPKNLNRTYVKHAKGTFIKCAWIILQVGCLICEYRHGSENSKQWNQNPKSILGAIELYMSYFAWSLLVYKFGRLQTEMTFAQFHQLYVWDFPHGPSFQRLKVKMLYQDLTPLAIESDSANFLKTVCNLMVTSFNEHFLQLGYYLVGYPDPSVDILRNHFVPREHIQIIRELANRATANNIDSMVQQVGIRPLWHRVTRLCVHCNQTIKDMLVNFMYDMEDKEIQLMASRRPPSDTKPNRLASAEYNSLLLNPQNRRLRGAWACVVDMLIHGALSYWGPESLSSIDVQPPKGKFKIIKPDKSLRIKKEEPRD